MRVGFLSDASLMGAGEQGMSTSTGRDSRWSSTRLVGFDVTEIEASCVDGYLGGRRQRSGVIRYDKSQEKEETALNTTAGGRLSLKVKPDGR